MGDRGIVIVLHRPHLRRRHGIWYCGIPDDMKLHLAILLRPLGHGDNPTQALDDWKAQQ